MDTYYMLEAGIHPYQRLPKQTLHERLDDETWKQFSDFIDEVLKEGETSFNFSELEKILSQVKKDTESIEFSDMKKALEIISAKLSLEPELITAIETQSPSLIRRSWNSIKKLYNFLMRAIKFLKDLVLKSVRYIWKPRTLLFTILLTGVVTLVSILNPITQTFQKTPLEIEDDQGHPVIMTKKADNPIAAKKLELASKLAVEEVVTHLRNTPSSADTLFYNFVEFLEEFRDGNVIYQANADDVGHEINYVRKMAASRWMFVPRRGALFQQSDLKVFKLLDEMIYDAKRNKDSDSAYFENSVLRLQREVVSSPSFKALLNELEVYGGDGNSIDYVFFIVPENVMMVQDKELPPKYYKDIKMLRGHYVKTLGSGDRYSIGLFLSTQSRMEIISFMKELQRKVGLIGG